MKRRMLSIYGSTVGKKVLMALTGLLMIVFLIGHLSGNLMLFRDDPVPFNHYADLLTSAGWVLLVVEILLLAIFVLHLISGISVYWTNRQSRPKGYSRNQSAGPPSRETIASKTMIWTGLVLLVFTALHVITFKYGPGIEEGYVTIISGKPVRDLHRLVFEVFQNPLYVIGYVGAMAFLGFHLRHGFWSAFQSLGAYHPRLTPFFYAFGYVLAVLLGLGFLAIPVWIFLQGVS